MAIFDIAKKGYDKKQVEDYLANMALKENNSNNDKNVRINELITQNNLLRGELNAYKKREEKVNNALVLAVEKANDIEKMANKRVQIELERIRAFSNKWVQYCDNIKVTNGIKERKGEVVAILKNLENEFIESFDKGLNLKCKADVNEADLQYQEEVNRLINGVKNDTLQSSQFSVKECGSDKCKEKNKAREIEQTLHDDVDVDKLLNAPEFEELCKKLGIV